MDDVEQLKLALADLTDRVSRLEGHSAPNTVIARAGEAAHEPLGPDVFWALNGLKSRLPAPGGVLYTGAVTIPAGPVEWQVGFATDHLLGLDWSAFATSLGALGHSVRLSLLHAIINGASGVAELSAGEGMGTTGQLYHHLGQLVSAGWLLAEGRGHYSIPVERVVPLLVILAASKRVS